MLETLFFNNFERHFSLSSETFLHAFPIRPKDSLNVGQRLYALQTSPLPDSKTRFEETMNKKTMPPSNRILVEGTMDEKGGVNLKPTMHIAILC